MLVKILYKYLLDDSLVREHCLYDHDEINRVLCAVNSAFYNSKSYKYLAIQVDGVIEWECSNVKFWCECGDEIDINYCKIYCEDCCTCWICDCGAHDRNQCEYCNVCSDCCNCQLCEDCSRLVHDDDTCGNCSRHCTCEESEFSYHGSHLATKHKASKNFKCLRPIGIEWEYNSTSGSHVRDWATYYGGGIHIDGSCGYEAVTPPLSGDHIRRVISELSNAMYKGKTCFNEDCSVHVHVDAKDYTWQDIYRLLEVYAHVEPVLYLLGGQNRALNNYCKPCGKEYLNALNSNDVKGSVLGVAYTTRHGNKPNGRRTAQSSPGKKTDGRYKGLNICPWLAGKKGKWHDTTIEFRIHRETHDASRVINWAETLALFVDWCQKASNKETKDLPKSPLRAMCEVIVPEKKEWILKRVEAWKKATSIRSRKIKLNGGYELCAE